MGENTTSLIIAGSVIALVVVAAVIILLRHKDKIAMMMLGVDDSDPIVINRGKQRMQFMGRDLDPMTGTPVDMTDSFTINSIYPPTGTFSPIIGMLPSDSGVFDVLDNGSDMMDDAIFDADAYSTPVDPFAAMPQNAYAAGMSAEMDREQQQQYVRPDAPQSRAAKRGGVESTASNDANDSPAQPDVKVSAVRAQSTGKFTVPSDKLDMSDRRYGTEQQDADYEIIEDGSSLDGMSTESIVNAVNDAARMYSVADAARTAAKEVRQGKTGGGSLATGGAGRRRERYSRERAGQEGCVSLQAGEGSHSGTLEGMGCPVAVPLPQPPCRGWARGKAVLGPV